MLLRSLPLIYRRRASSRPRSQTPPAPPVPLTLVSASFSSDPSLVLTFDRAIDLAGFDGTAIVVEDGIYTFKRYDATGGWSVLDPTSIVISLNEIGDLPSGSVLLTASNASGIVAVDDGGTWVGVTDLELPFP